MWRELRLANRLGWIANLHRARHMSDCQGSNTNSNFSRVLQNGGRWVTDKVYLVSHRLLSASAVSISHTADKVVSSVTQILLPFKVYIQQIFKHAGKTEFTFWHRNICRVNWSNEQVRVQTLTKAWILHYRIEMPETNNNIGFLKLQYKEKPF